MIDFNYQIILHYQPIHIVDKAFFPFIIFRQCEIGVKGAYYLGINLLNCKNLIKLDLVLGNNNFKDEGANNLINLFKHKTLILLSLNLQDNGITPELQNKIQRKAQKMKKLTYFQAFFQYCYHI
ncbi:hypothetical protein ABPG74_016094 [Tetrahymena malaccensis]